MKKNFLQKNKKNKKKGFAILYAVVISSMLLAIALGVSSIALKEINFSTSGKDTNDAFFAADTGAECALFNDKISINNFSNGSGLVQCASLGVNTFVTNFTASTWNFTITGLGSSGSGCTLVTVDKTTVPFTKIVSKGYSNNGNTGTSPFCTPSSNSVERQLELNY